MYRKLIYLSLVISFWVFQVKKSQSCNEVVCGSVVTKCLLTEACSCTIKNCSCCQHCFACLGDVFDECCSCLGLCPSLSNNWANLSKTSYVEEIEEKLPNLFNALTELPDPIDRWSIVTFPVEIDMATFAPKELISLQMKDTNRSSLVNRHIEVINCTVTYMANCMSLDKCKGSCKSMGASSFRWFHDGCCECVGETCINYGLNESRCRRCKMNRNKEDNYNDDLDQDDVDYGQNYDEADEEYDEYLDE